jgi:hypothetical protein
MIRLIVICITVVLSITALSYYTAQASIESYKQNAFMMKACVDAGGQWMKGWTPQWDCIRPSNHQ